MGGKDLIVHCCQGLVTIYTNLLGEFPTGDSYDCNQIFIYRPAFLFLNHLHLPPPPLRFLA